MRETYPQNQHAREWADEIERVFIGDRRSEAAQPAFVNGDRVTWQGLGNPGTVLSVWARSDKATIATVKWDTGGGTYDHETKFLRHLGTADASKASEGGPERIVLGAAIRVVTRHLGVSTHDLNSITRALNGLARERGPADPCPVCKVSIATACKCVKATPGYYHPDPATDAEVRQDVADRDATDRAAGITPGWHKGAGLPNAGLAFADGVSPSGHYRKRPVVIRAWRWFPGSTVPGVREETELRRRESETGPPSYAVVFGVIDTLEGLMRVASGDWIITGVKGERYPCKPDIFELTYEPVIDASPAAGPNASPATCDESTTDLSHAVRYHCAEPRFPRHTTHTAAKDDGTLYVWRVSPRDAQPTALPSSCAADELRIAATVFLTRWGGHSGSCCTFDPGGLVIVTRESCRCDVDSRRLRTALDLWDTGPVGPFTRPAQEKK